MLQVQWRRTLRQMLSSVLKKTHYFENKEIGSEMDEAFEME